MIIARSATHLLDQTLGRPVVPSEVLDHDGPVGEVLVPLIRGPRPDLTRPKDEEVIGREVYARDPESGVRDERPEGLNDEVALGPPSERLERPIELLPTARERAHALFGDRHARLECARCDPRVVIVVDANAVLAFGLTIGLQGSLSRGFAVEMSEQ